MGVRLAHNNIRRNSNWATHVSSLLVLLSLSYLIIGRQFYTINITLDIQRRTALPMSYKCKPPLPKLLQKYPPTLNEYPSLRWTALKLDAQLAATAALPGTDNLVVAVVTPAGVLWSKGYGRRHANETGNFAPPDLDTSYRIGSISKVFATLETLILRERGALNLDDPVIKFLPNFTHRSFGWKEYLNGISRGELEYNTHTPITLRQLASHMSGIGRDYPPFNVPHWPYPTISNSSFLQYHLMMTNSTSPWADVEAMKQAIARYPLIVPSYSYPIYSNTGFAVLGWCNVAAAKHVNKTSPNTYAALLRRDIFSPLQMKGSSFLASDLPGDHIAFPSRGDEVDWDLGEAMNSAGGQFSSARDLARVMQIFLDPSKEDSLVSPLVMREWLRPLHAWSDEINEVGMPWEILKLPDSNGRPQRWYQKAGALVMSHSLFSFNPATSFGVIALHNGVYGDMQYFVKKAIDAFQPVFETILENQTRRLYGGTWVANDSNVVLTVSDGSLWVTKMIVNGKNVLSAFWGTDKVSVPLTLWSTEREDEFRIAFGLGAANTLPSMGCTPYWFTIDGFYSHGAPYDVLYFEGSGKDRVMHYPSMAATLRRP